MNENKYYVPISHDTSKRQTSILIADKKRIISSLKFSFMIPVPDSVITRIDFNKIAEKDKKYADLLMAEYEFCAANKERLIKKAEAVYRIGCNQNHKLHSVCCNFHYWKKRAMNIKNIID